MGADRIAVFGGVYSNYLALDAVCLDARRRGAHTLVCLGDLGAFGPHPERVFPLLERHRVITIQGNYEVSLAARYDDCQCGYTDPRDNRFARLAYEYTAAHTSEAAKDWMGSLPAGLRLDLGRRSLLMAHGSPRKVNEFLWRSTSSLPFLRRLLDEARTDVLLVTHTGLPWHRRMPDGRHVVNVGVIGRPANNGRTEVVYALLTEGPELGVEWVWVAYDHARLASEMEEERIPREFVETILTGWWTTCLEILPAKERAEGRF
jgi:diadenosine tetraphosphatase ApaH/serine/threonine PP2A family protein phosphatase